MYEEHGHDVGDKDEGGGRIDGSMGVLPPRWLHDHVIHYARHHHEISDEDEHAYGHGRWLSCWGALDAFRGEHKVVKGSCIACMKGSMIAISEIHNIY